MGIYVDKRTNTWVARTRTKDGKREYLGTFKTKEAAEKAFKVSELVLERGFIHPLYDDHELIFEQPKDTRSLFQRLFRRA